MELLLVCTFCVWIKYVWAPSWMGRKEGCAEGLKAVADGVCLDDFRTRLHHDGMILFHDGD